MPKLIIPADVELKLHQYVRSVNTEIAGMGKISLSDDGEIITVEDVMIYEQEVTGGTADLSSEALAAWQTEMVKKGESLKDWKLWWHSHANMSAFFSKRDTDTIDQSYEYDFLVSLVVNRSRKREARIDTFRPFRIELEDLDIEIPEEVCNQCGHSLEREADEMIDIPAEVIEEVKQKVKIKSFNDHTNHSGYKSLPYPSYNGGPQFPKAVSVHDGESDDELSSFVVLPEVSELDDDELLAAIDTSRARMRELADSGQYDTEEYKEIAETLGDYLIEANTRSVFRR